jgi:hypothetical protein
MPKRNVLITVFVIVWLALFHYESLRHQVLSPLAGRALPKLKFLFPPAGWIMFFNVGESEVRAEVYGKRGGSLELIDPHRIFDNRWLGYDNIHRNILVTVLDPRHADALGAYLRRKFPEYQAFYVMQVVYPSNIRFPGMKRSGVVYAC